jgi:hypothetical protein
MAKGRLTFKLPKEQSDWEMANKASDAYYILEELDIELRNHLRYGSHPEWNDTTVEEIRKILNDLMADRSIQFN